MPTISRLLTCPYWVLSGAMMYATTFGQNCRMTADFRGQGISVTTSFPHPSILEQVAFGGFSAPLPPHVASSRCALSPSCPPPISQQTSAGKPASPSGVPVAWDFSFPLVTAHYCSHHFPLHRISGSFEIGIGSRMGRWQKLQEPVWTMSSSQMGVRVSGGRKVLVGPRQHFAPAIFLSVKKPKFAVK